MTSQSKCNNSYDTAYIGFIGIYDYKRIKAVIKVIKSILESSNIKGDSVTKVNGHLCIHSLHTPQLKVLLT